MDFNVQFSFFNCLKDAVISKDPRKVEETLKEFEEKGIPIAQLVSMQDEDSDTLLHIAVKMGNPDILRQLLVYSDEESVNQCTTLDHLSPMMLLLWRSNCLASDEEMLRSLLAAKANPNLWHSDVRWMWWRNDRYISHLPLFCALQTRQWRMVEILLDAGADPHKHDCADHAIDLCLEKAHLMQRLLDVGCYSHDLLNIVLTTNYEGRSEESTLHLCKMILPYHSAPELDCEVIIDAAGTGFHEVLLFLLSELKPGLKLGRSYYLPQTLLVVSRDITPQNYRRFLSVYFRFLDLNQFDESAYLFLLLTAQHMDLLKMLFQEAKQRKLEVTKWRELGSKFYSTGFNYDREHENAAEPSLWCRCYKSDRFIGKFLCDNDSMLSFDVLSTAAHYISSPRAFTGILPTLLELGLKSSPLALASFAMRAVREEFKFHLTNPEFRDVLTRLSSNCCEENGTCWFREPFFLGLCSDALKSNFHRRSRRVLLTSLRLGVDIGDVFRREPHIYISELDEITVEIIKLFEPRPVTCWLPQSPKAPAIIAKFDEREPASLMQLSRQACRSGLGFCRIEEKIESFKHEMPRVVYNYLCFRDDASLACFEKNKFDPEVND